MSYTEKRPFRHPLLSVMLLGLNFLIFILTFSSYNSNFGQGPLALKAYIPIVAVLVLNLVYWRSRQKITINASGIFCRLSPFERDRHVVGIDRIIGYHLISIGEWRKHEAAIPLAVSLRLTGAAYVLEVQLLDGRELALGVSSTRSAQVLALHLTAFEQERTLQTA